MADPVLYEQEGHVALITLNQPELRTRSPMPRRSTHWSQRSSGSTATCRCCAAILTGAGSAFSSGGNVKRWPSRAAAWPTKSRPRPRATTRAAIQRIPLAFDRLEVPIIAAVNGPAIGAGCDLACMCDIPHRRDERPFRRKLVKLGIIPGDGGAWLLAARGRFLQGSEMAFTGDPVDAQEALACGLVSRVVPDAELLPTAKALAARIAANPAACAAHDQAPAARGPAQQSRYAARILRRSAGAGPCDRADHKEAIGAFLGKRPPSFTGE
ncbi:MAG: enoyl-CoA hydratase-related protein [Aliidongia sp.]